MKKLNLILAAVIISFGLPAGLTAQIKKSAADSSKHRLQRRDRFQNREVSKNDFKTAVPVIKETPSPVLPAPLDNIPSVLTTSQDKTEPSLPKLVKLADETLGGNMVVDVSSNSNTVIKVGLAERAVTLIDFPANDPVYKIHPGNENFVTVGCTGREASGKCLNSPTDAIVLRPGKDFHSLGDEDSAATVITIQRVSGIVVTLLVVPVKKISDNTNYVAIRYQLDQVLANRRNSGLPINMPAGNAAPNFTILPALVTVDDLIADNRPPSENDPPPVQGTTTGMEKPLSLDELLYTELQNAAQNSSALKFSKPVYGISLARVSGGLSKLPNINIEIIAARNTLSQALRLVPDQPQLLVENRDSKETSINIQAVPLLNVVTTVEDTDVLLPGQIYFYAVAYESPILGVRQALRVSFAQRAAADAPASITISGISR